jgi:hypothetical protein
MAAFTLNVSVGLNPATGIDAGQTCNAYKASRFTSPPTTNTAAPGGGADYGPNTSDVVLYATGGVSFSSSTYESFYVSFYDPADTSNAGTFNLYWTPAVSVATALPVAQVSAMLNLEAAALPTGTLAETFPISFAVNNAAIGASSGVLQLAAVYLPAGAVIGNLGAVSSATLNTPSHWWFALLDSSRNLLAVTADQTTAAWAARTLKTLPIATVASGASATFTTVYAGLYYLGVMAAYSGATFGLVQSDTMQGTYGAITNWTGPNLAGPSGSGLTTPPAFPFTASAPGFGATFYGLVMV